MAYARGAPACRRCPKFPNLVLTSIQVRYLEPREARRSRAKLDQANVVRGFLFGYHEVFHALTIVALACQYVAIAFFVVRVG